MLPAIFAPVHRGDSLHLLFVFSALQVGNVLCFTLLVSKIPQRRNIHGIRAVRRDETCILEFESFDDVCEMIVHLPAETLEKMRLYGILDRFYITTGRKNITALMYEYCTKCKKNSTAEARLGEYAAMIADGKALAKIALNAKKLK